jgi:hypothetical protein
MTGPERPDLHVVEAVPAVSESGRIPDDDEGDTESLSARETRFVDALAAGTTPHEAAKAIGLSDRSGRRWRQKSYLMAAIKVRLADSIAVGRSILAAGMAKAATGLVAMASGESAADSARVSACRAVTEGAVKLCELADLQAQLAEIQAQLAGQPRAPNTFNRGGFRP